MKLKILNKNTLLLILFLLLSFICGKLGLWQISRGYEKKSFLKEQKIINTQNIIFVSDKQYVVEEGNKKYKIFRIIEIDREIYFLELGRVDSFKDLPVINEEDIRNKRFSYWPIKNNKFIKSKVIVHDNYEQSYQLIDFFQTNQNKMIHQDYFIYIDDLLDNYERVNHSIPISHEKHFGYAFQWFLFSMTAFIYAINLLRNQKFKK